MTKKDKRENFDLSDLWPFFLIMSVVMLAFGLLVVKGFKLNFEDLGPYGDFLGGTTIPFLTLTSIFMILRTINLQSDQLNTQREELKLVQKEMEDTKIALQEQSKTTKMQRFEHTFFIQIEQIKKIYSGENKRNFYFLNKKMIAYLKNEINHGNILDYDENNLKEYNSYYNSLVSNAYDRARIMDEEAFGDLLEYTHRSLIIIYHYSNIMDDWELQFYLDYLYREIGGEEIINLILFSYCIFKMSLANLNELNFHKQYANPANYASRADLRYFDYMFASNGDINII